MEFYDDVVNYNFEAVDAALRGGMDPTAILTSTGDTGLSLAAQHRNVAMFRMMLVRLPRSYSPGLVTATISAALAGNSDAIGVIAKHCGPTEAARVFNAAVGHENIRPLHLVTSAAAAYCLIKHGARTSVQTLTKKLTPAMAAASSGKWDVLLAIVNSAPSTLVVRDADNRTVADHANGLAARLVVRLHAASHDQLALAALLREITEHASDVPSSLADLVRLRASADSDRPDTPPMAVK